ncbi:hypothetical protein [Flavisolibacter tropicus]|uniref:Uncharacterized protein n=1 Tax=Flavisolibacter tropicus TaxID=1492898 RepID=A0A172TY13_9BACT|nr:hypothetical protein [Flavisolibacter tropicus]ANE51896.1 hypothetical protein SY85_16745 [Flavisolibacter tropicus]
MGEEPTIQNEFRKLDIELPRIRRENSLFWWLAGIALAVCFLALTLHFFMLYKKRQQQPSYKVQSQ